MTKSRMLRLLWLAPALIFINVAMDGFQFVDGPEFEGNTLNKIMANSAYIVCLAFAIPFIKLAFGKKKEAKWELTESEAKAYEDAEDVVHPKQKTVPLLLEKFIFICSHILLVTGIAIFIYCALVPMTAILAYGVIGVALGGYVIGVIVKVARFI